MSNGTKPEKPPVDKVSEEDKFFAAISRGLWTPEQLAEIREESYLISQNFFVDKFLPYLERIVHENVEYYYLDIEKAESSSELDKHERILLDSSAISKVDSLFLILVSLFFSISAIVNSFYGLPGFVVALVALFLILISPFYVGYVQGALWDNMERRLRGWEILIVQLAAVFAFLGSLPILTAVNMLPKIIRLFIGRKMVVIGREWIGLAFLTVLFALEVIVLVWVRRKLLIRIVTFYFDRFPTKRDQLVKAVTKIGILPFANPLNMIVAAMKKKKDLDFNWMGRQFTITKGLVEAKALLRQILLDDILSLSRLALFAGFTSMMLAVIFFYVFGFGI